MLFKLYLKGFLDFIELQRHIGKEKIQNEASY